MTTLTGSTLYMQQSGATIQYSPDRTSWTTISTWPTTLGTSGATLSFTTDLSFSTSSQYFIIGAANQTIDGSFNIVYINNINGFFGLVKNGNYTYPGTTSTSFLQFAGGAYASSTLKNIHVQSVNSGLMALASTGSAAETAASNNGKPSEAWLCQRFYGSGTTGHLIDYCSTNGPTRPTSWIKFNGTIVAGSSGYSPGAGLIHGDGVSIALTRCFTSSEVASYCGGIVNNTTGSITNCYTTGSVGTGQANMGLVLGLCNTSGVTATNCYSTGIFDNAGTGGGGIFGPQANNCSVVNCYSFGVYTGGIAARGMYHTGNTTGFTITKCYYPYTGIWSDTVADASLNNAAGAYTDINLGSTGVPWRLTAFTRNLYGSSSGADVTSVTPIISGTHTWSIVSISVNGGAKVATYSGISINSSTGVLSFSGLSTGTYAVNVMAVHSVTTGYYFQTYTNTVASTRVVGPTNIFSLTSSRDLSGIFAPYTSSAAPVTQIYCVSGGSYFDLNAIFQKYTGANGTAETTGILCLSGGSYFDLNSIFEKK